MEKIPVGATIAQTYNFALTEFPKILGRIWLPWFATSLCGYFLIPGLVAALKAAEIEDYAAALNYAKLMLALIPLGIVIYVIQIAATIDLALQSSRYQRWIWWPEPKSILRLIGAYSLSIFVYLAAWIVAIIISLILGLILSAATSAAKQYTEIISAVGLGAIAATVYAAFIYVTVRFVYLLAPIVLAEKQISYGRTLDLGAGNFWRMLMIFGAAYAPFWACGRLFLWFVTPNGILLSPPPGATPEIRAAVFANVMSWTAGLLQKSLDYWYITYPVGLVWWVLYLGILFGAQAFIYRAVTEREEAAQNFS